MSGTPLYTGWCVCGTLLNPSTILRMVPLPLGKGGNRTLRDCANGAGKILHFYTARASPALHYLREGTETLPYGIVRGGGKILHCVQNDRLFVGDGACDIPQAWFVHLRDVVESLHHSPNGPPPFRQGRQPHPTGLRQWGRQDSSLLHGESKPPPYIIYGRAQRPSPTGLCRRGGDSSLRSE